MTARELCYKVTGPDSRAPLFVLSLPTQECDFDKLLPDILHIIDTEAATKKRGGKLDYQLLIFCAGKHRPTWPWLLQNFTKLDKRYKKGLQKLYLVHEKSWIRVCMQLLENVVSPKFARKVRHVRDLARLQQVLGGAMEKIRVPEEALRYDETLIQDDKQSKMQKQKKKQRSRPEKSSDNDGDDEMAARKSGGGGGGEKRRLSPPVVPPSRSLSRSQSPTKVTRTSITSAPNPPPRRSLNSQTSITSMQARASEPLVIFEDPSDEDAAAATLALEHALKTTKSPEKVSGLRSSSAPIISSHPPVVPRHPETLRSAQGQTGTLRRAISGPLTPSSSLKQNFLPPIDKNVAPPKLMIHGKEYSVKTRSVKPGEGGGKVGGLKALFEQKALVAQSMA